MRHHPVPSIFHSVLQYIPVLLISSYCFAESEEPVNTKLLSDVSDVVEVTGELVEVDLAESIKVFPVSPDALVHRVVVGGGSGSVAAAGTEPANKLVYSNTLGRGAYQLPANYLIADDLVLLAPDGCSLDRFTFQVSGKANPEGEGGAYRVDFGLYDGFPGAGGKVISGTDGFVEFDESDSEVIQQIEIIIPDHVEIFIPTNLWLGLITSQENVGIIGGAPPMVGFSDNIFFFQRLSRGIFNSEVYVRGDCPDAFPAYHNVNDERDGFNPGTQVWLADDLELGVETCDMVGYEVGVRGVGFYTFELLTDLDGMPGAAISGTRKIIVNSEPDIFVRRNFTVDPPITIDKNVWMAARVGNTIGGWVLTGRDAILGQTDSSFFIKNVQDQWVQQFPPGFNYGGFYINIICAGQPPVGACCDMFIGECVGGRDDGKTCRGNGNCKNPGTCEAVCREIPKMNCSFPLRGSPLQPSWMEGNVCDPDPFPFACGKSACCTLDGSCENLTENECNEIEPVDDPRDWQLGKYCGENHQKCPFLACYYGEGDCVVAHTNPGCEDGFCCNDVCDADSYCCEVEWDRQCVTNAALFCDLAPANDECYDPREGRGALLVATDSSTLSDSLHATTNETDPGFCCNLDDPGGQGFNTVWYKFVANSSIETISAKDPDNNDADTLLQVFSVGDPTSEESACQTLIPIACNDNAINSFSANDSYLLLKDLITGETYYVLVASKTSHRHYRVTIGASAGYYTPPANDLCKDAELVQDGMTNVNLYNASSECPITECGELLERDVWFDYVASCTGEMVVTPCFCDYTDVDVVSVYDGCDCPVDTEKLLACYNRENSCCQASMGQIPVIGDVEEGQCLKIRASLKVNSDSFPSVPRIFQIDCVQCDPGEVVWIDPPKDVVDARRPHPYIPCDANGQCSLVPLNQMEGINEFEVTTPSVTHQLCWNVEQTSFNPDLHPRSCCDNSDVREIIVNEGNSKNIKLLYKLKSGEATTISYSDDAGGEQSARFVAMPGDVDGNLTVCPQDVEELIDVLKDVKQPLWGKYSADLDHSGEIHPADILQLIDLMNGAGAYKAWLHATLLPEENQCP